MRERVDQLGVAEPEIQQAGGEQINVALPDVSSLADAIRQVGTVAQLAFYDWETNVIGADGRPDPENVGVTGGPAAGDPPPACRSTTRCCAPRSARRRSSRQLPRRSPLLRRRPQAKGLRPRRGVAPDALANVKNTEQRKKADVIVVKPDTVLLRARRAPDGPKPDAWFVLQDDVALQGKEIKTPSRTSTRARAARLADRHLRLHRQGPQDAEVATKAIAQRGQESVGILPSQTGDQVLQHFAIVLDNELVSSPTIDFRQYPEGIDGATARRSRAASRSGPRRNSRTSSRPARCRCSSSTSPTRRCRRRSAARRSTRASPRASRASPSSRCFCSIFYRVLGVIAVVALAVYGVYFFALIKAIPSSSRCPASPA